MAAKRRAERLAKNIAVRFKRTKIIIYSFLMYMNISYGFHILQEYGDSKRAQALWDVDSDDEEEDILEPNPKLSQGKNSTYE